MEAAVAQFRFVLHWHGFTECGLTLTLWDTLRTEQANHSSIIHSLGPVFKHANISLESLLCLPSPVFAVKGQMYISFGVCSPALSHRLTAVGQSLTSLVWLWRHTHTHTLFLQWECVIRPWTGSPDNYSWLWVHRYSGFEFYVTISAAMFHVTETTLFMQTVFLCQHNDWALL